VIFCAASGILCGLLTAAQCQRAESGCQIAPLESLFDDPAAWTIWLHWVNWLPGVVFGLLFAFATRRASPAGGPRQVALYGAAAGAVYLIAGLLFYLILSIARGDQFAAIVWVWPAGLVAGMAGGFGLAVTANLALAGSPHPPRALPGSGLPALVGAAAGLLFVFICTYGEQAILIAWPLAFVIWQIPIGLVLMRLRA
jgi:hypothetical protein